MKLQSLYLANFRNFQEASIDFGPKLNVFYGLNAQGKTSLLEAISLISTGRSFRTYHFSELIKTGAEFFLIEATIEKDAVKQTVRLSFDGTSKTVECNGNRSSTFQALMGLLPSIIFTPNDLDLINGAPSARRRFLNIHLAQSDPLYFHHYLRFWRALKQRNALLRIQDLNGIECWEQEMASSAAYLFAKRDQLIESLNIFLKLACETLSAEKMHLKYLPSPSDPSAYPSQLSKNRPREMQLGLTLTGPHRDDCSMHIQEQPARLFASDGQKRTALAAIRLAEWQLLRKQIGGRALFGIDDLELYLDPERQQRLKEALHQLGQVFLTTPQIDPQFSDARRFQIHAGTVLR